MNLNVLTALCAVLMWGAIPSGSYGQQAAAKFTNADAFQLIYLKSRNFDHCGQRLVGEKFRKLLEIQFKACFSASDQQVIDLPYLKNQIHELDTDIDQHNLKALSGGDLEDCKKFLSEPSERETSINILQKSSSAFLMSMPENCNNYKWMVD